MSALEHSGHYRIHPVHGDPGCITAQDVGQALHVQPPSTDKNQIWDIRMIEHDLYHIVLKDKPDFGASTFPGPAPFQAVRLLDRLSAFRLSNAGGPDMLHIAPAETDELTVAMSGGKDVVLTPTDHHGPFAWRFVRA
ncbi:hypothetical protein PSEUBRA_003113 [Kalmanozyma brasiliensis GHG001]|uniref:uncharacterized protein n=1 Tax=Kalmanozyma brasiliensis (strain GHG001) TaxID=1365824 RepID=UPI001CEA3D29|nr:uncharacterized protein PSEUBRA_003113 [Kalmanozyma brasiliensis GHG001]KAF6767189.1 hypothetical protein PSEUBRA_003113 [Kalmanozyma brasiliensis GHG001]